MESIVLGKVKGKRSTSNAGINQENHKLNPNKILCLDTLKNAKIIPMYEHRKQEEVNTTAHGKRSPQNWGTF